MAGQGFRRNRPTDLGAGLPAREHARAAGSRTVGDRAGRTPGDLGPVQDRSAVRAADCHLDNKDRTSRIETPEIPTQRVGF